MHSITKKNSIFSMKMKVFSFISMSMWTTQNTVLSRKVPLIPLINKCVIAKTFYYEFSNSSLTPRRTLVTKKDDLCTFSFLVWLRNLEEDVLCVWLVVISLLRILTETWFNTSFIWNFFNARVHVVYKYQMLNETLI